MRGLRALGVSAVSYGALLTSIIMNKLPSEIRLTVSREFTGAVWSVEKMMEVVGREIDARERSVTSHVPLIPCLGNHL